MKTRNNSTMYQTLLKPLLWNAIVFLICQACHIAANKHPNSTVQHWKERSSEYGGAVYIDSLPNSTLVHNETGSPSSSRFISFLVGFREPVHTSMSGTDKPKQEYYQFQMEKDWCLYINGDSFKPVFSQPKNRMDQLSWESVLVFEIPKDVLIDSLVYKDSYHHSGPLSFVLMNQ